MAVARVSQDFSEPYLMSLILGFKTETKHRCFTNELYSDGKPESVKFHITAFAKESEKVLHMPCALVILGVEPCRVRRLGSQLERLSRHQEDFRGPHPRLG